MLRVVAPSRLAVLWRSVSAAPDWVFCNLKIGSERAVNSAQFLLGKPAWGNSLHLKWAGLRVLCHCGGGK